MNWRSLTYLIGLTILTTVLVLSLALVVQASYHAAFHTMTTGEQTEINTNLHSSDFSFSNVTEIPQTECAALIALYNSTNGPNWSTKDGWLLTLTPCSWYGVNCTGGHVTALHLSSNQLVGSIPAALGNLTELGGLYLCCNQLSGNIPPELGNLVKLGTVTVGGNQLSGSIPPQLGNLTLLNGLELSANQLSGSIPRELGRLTNLEYLMLNGNQLTGGVPAQLGGLTNLSWLFLNDNQFNGSLPGNLVKLTQLTRFFFDNANLCEPADNTFQSWLTNISDLQRTGVTCATLSGVFYNLGAQAGGSVQVDLTLQPTEASGYINFTQRSDDPRPLCGAADFSGSRNGDSLALTFISFDQDPGCGFDHNAIFTMTAQIDQNETHFWGDYGIKNSNGSHMSEAPGVFEIWTSGSEPQRRIYHGQFTNTSVGRGGTVSIEIGIGTNTVFGYINFTNDPNTNPLCGAGEFTGVHNPSTTEFSFISHDTDPGCGFDHGRGFLINATLSDDNTTITGDYRVDNNQVGVFHATFGNVISGQVTGNDNCKADVTITTNSGHSDLTDTEGNYIISGLSAGTYILTASKNGCTFSTPPPVTLPPSATEVDFAATQEPGDFSISVDKGEGSTYVLKDNLKLCWILPNATKIRLHVIPPIGKLNEHYEQRPWFPLDLVEQSVGQHCSIFPIDDSWIPGKQEVTLEIIDSTGEVSAKTTTWFIYQGGETTCAAPNYWMTQQEWNNIIQVWATHYEQERSLPLIKRVVEGLGLTVVSKFLKLVSIFKSLVAFWELGRAGYETWDLASSSVAKYDQDLNDLHAKMNIVVDYARKGHHWNANGENICVESNFPLETPPSKHPYLNAMIEQIDGGSQRLIDTVKNTIWSSELVSTGEIPAPELLAIELISFSAYSTQIYEAATSPPYPPGPVYLYFTDPLQRHIGLDPVTGEEVNQIPDAVFLIPESGRQVIIIQEPGQGIYELAYTAVADGNYEVTVTALAGQTQFESYEQGTMAGGQSKTGHFTIIEKVYLPLIQQSQ